MVYLGQVHSARDEGKTMQSDRSLIDISMKNTGNVRIVPQRKRGILIFKEKG